MEFALALLKLWRLRIWVGLGALVAVGAAVASLQLGHSTVYAAASTEMVVDAPRSALGNVQADLTPYLSRAGVFARLMTSDAALQYIGREAGIPGELIAASGPSEIGSPEATHTPTATQNGQVAAPAASYVLRFDQNPLLPTIDIYAQAPTPTQAIALANGAVTGFAAYLSHLEAQGNVPTGQRVELRQLGAATGGIVDAGASKSMAGVIFVMVFVMWCFFVLLASRLRENLRIARNRSQGAADGAEHATSLVGDVPSVPGHAGHPLSDRLLRPRTGQASAGRLLGDTVAARQHGEQIPPSDFLRR